MYTYIMLLSICALTTANESRFTVWGALKNLFNATHNMLVPEDARLNITQLAQKYAYPFEEHMVITADGYILHLHRINGMVRSEKPKPIVFLMHGLMESSDCWMLLGPGKGLAYVLSDSGFDVWMGNARGNKHALNHIALNNTIPGYWNFGIEEIATYDLPAMIEYILQLTGQESLYYIGHSQGTAVGYILCSMKQEYNYKIKIMISLAPAVWMGNIRSPVIKYIVSHYNVLKYMLRDWNPFSSGLDLFKKVSTFICSVLTGGCVNILYALSGHETKIDDSFLSVILGHAPTGCSSFQLLHYGQLVRSQRFCRYNYGEEENMVKYGNSTPPDYDLSLVSVPVMIFYSSKDWLSDPRDVDTLKKHLPYVYDYISLDEFTHIDYIYAVEAAYKIYIRIVSTIFKFEKDHSYKPEPRYT